MATTPTNTTLTNSTADILNAVRNTIGGDYALAVPAAENDNRSIRDVGEAILAYQPNQNAFVSTLVNRIVFVSIKSEEYKNPWAMFKRGFLELGETVEEIFVNLASVKKYNPTNSPSTVFSRTIPSIYAGYHSMNIQVEYPVTISEDQLRQAFTSINGVTDLIKGIITSVVTAMNYDEFNVMKYMLGRLALDAKIKVISISEPNASNAHGIVTSIKSVSNKFEFMSDEYNYASVKNNCYKNNQYLLEQSDLNAVIDVNVLASAFNMDKAEFMGHVVTFDSIGTLDTDRLDIILAGDTNYTSLTDAELGYLDKIRAILCSKGYFMIYDNLQKMTEAYNGDGLYMNYFLHKWQTMSTSPFENVVLFTDLVSTVSVSITEGSTGTITVSGGTLQLHATVTKTGFAPTGVTWSVGTGTGTASKWTVSDTGLVTCNETTAGKTMSIKATSVFDSTEIATITLTSAAAE